MTRDIFKEKDEAKELRHSGVSFHKFEGGKFLFGVDACIPDTDVCEAAEVAVDQTGIVKIVRFLNYEEVEN